MNNKLSPKTNRHVPVMLNEVLAQLRLESGMTVVDATLGNAGHAQPIAAAIGPQGTLVGIDADPLAIEESAAILEDISIRPTIHLIQDNFANLDQILQKLEVNEVDGVLMDLGLRRGSLEDTGRGFSFQRPKEPLDMRFDPQNPDLQTAATILNTFSADSLADIFYYLADERLSRQYAEAIVQKRSEKEFKTVGDLVEVIEANTPRKILRPGRSAATRVFQALRIAVNHEFEALDKAINEVLLNLVPGGRLVIITFHSIEDRIVKQKFKDLSAKGLAIIDPKKATKPTREEIINNKLARSATLRAITKTN